MASSPQRKTLTVSIYLWGFTAILSGLNIFLNFVNDNPVIALIWCCTFTLNVALVIFNIIQLRKVKAAEQASIQPPDPQA